MRRTYMHMIHTVLMLILFSVSGVIQKYSHTQETALSWAVAMIVPTVWSWFTYWQGMVIFGVRYGKTRHWEAQVFLLRGMSLISLYSLIAVFKNWGVC